MFAVLGVLVVLAVVCGVALWAEVRHFVRRHKVRRILWRWFTGRALHGQSVPVDGHWHWPGAWFWRLTRPQRAGVRWLVTLLVVAVPPAWVASPQVTEVTVLLVLACLLAAGLGVAGYGAYRWRHRRRWERPAQSAIALRFPEIEAPLRVARDLSWARQPLPQAWPADSKEEAALVELIKARVAIENPEPSWRRHGPAPVLTIRAAVPCPSLVTLADLMPHIIAARPDEIVWGLGRKGVPVTSSLSADSPHIGVSAGSGGGKSVLVRAALAQMLFHGAVALILDFKQLSQHWATGLPNVAICRDPDEIHNALQWLNHEIHQRNKDALSKADLEGNVHGLGFPRLIIAGEELNATMKVLRQHWRHQRDEDKSLPVRSPALDALDMINLMGRQALMNVLYIGQRLSAKAAGGDGDVRESIGVIAMGRYRPSTWKMLAEDHPMPPATRKAGRFQIVSDDVREVQAGRVSAVEARDLALAGMVSYCPPGMPGRAVSGGTHAAISGPEQVFVPETRTPPRPPGELVTLQQAIDEGVVQRSIEALRRQSTRDELFPESHGYQGLAKLYKRTELADWDEGRYARN